MLFAAASMQAGPQGNVPLTAAPNVTTTFATTAFLQVATNLSLTLSNVYTAQNGTVTLCDGAIAYTPAFGFTGRDSFGVAITNAAGAGSLALVSVNVQPTPLVMQPGGAVQLQLIGTAGVDFNIQASTDLSGWTTIGSAAAGSNGVVSFTDTNAASYSSRYYRLSTP